MSEQSKFVYLVHRSTRHATWELGIFSSDELAEHACKTDCCEDIHINPDNKLIWDFVGEMKFCEVGLITYFIIPVELDVRITHDSV